MRNDARPVGEDSPASPLGGHDREPPRRREEGPLPSERHDSRSSVAHDRQSHIVHEEAARDQSDQPGKRTIPR